jgi:ribosomal protein L11 methylase PrmA
VTDVVVELIVLTDGADLVADSLWLAGATAVAESAVGERTADVVKLVASFPTADAARVVAAEVGGTLIAIEPSEWQDRWKDFAQPVAVGPDLLIAPAWRTVSIFPAERGVSIYPAERGATRDSEMLTGADECVSPHNERGTQPLIIRIDPGPCFGSGSHPSSRLILAQLMSFGGSLAGQKVLDVGCGSGILSVTAARLGAVVTAVDIDPDAVRYTETNAAANGVAERVSASTAPVAAVTPPSGCGGFDLALVNVTAGVHAGVGPATAKAVRPGATLLLAGLLPGQWRHVAGSYPGTAVVGRPELDGWEGVVLTRTA